MVKLTALALFLSGCSLIAVRDPADVPPGRPQLCDPRPVWPIVADSVTAGVSGVVLGAAGITAIHDDHNAAVGAPLVAGGVVMVAALGISAAIGYRRGAD